MEAFDWIVIGIYSGVMLAMFIVFTIIWRKLK